VADPASITDLQWAELQKEYSFTSRPHAAWWLRKLQVDLAGDVHRAQREYPVTPAQAFAFAEGRWIHAFTAAEGIVVKQGDPMRLFDSRTLEVEYAHEAEPCIYGVDTGSGHGGDFSALGSIGRGTGRLHRVFASNKLNVPSFAREVVARAKDDKPWMVVVETNGIGQGCADLLREAGLPVVEHVSSQGEKLVRFSELGRAIESGALPIGPELELELKSSVVSREGKYTGRDDILSAVSFARSQYVLSPYVAPPPKVDPRQYVVPPSRLKKTTF
jgi:hypothetical protein